MKNISNALKTAPLLAFVILSSFCSKAALKPGEMIAGQFVKNNTTIFVATVTAVNGNQFTCRFVQSNVEYVFSSDSEGSGVVISSKGGKYAKGERFVFVEYFISDDSYGCIISKTENAYVIARFPDGKTYLGGIYMFDAKGGFKVMFMHSGSVYTFDKDCVVLSQKGGTYKAGTQVKIFCAEMANPVPVGMKMPTAQDQ